MLCVNAIGAVVGPYVLTVGVGITGVQARQDVFGRVVTMRLMRHSLFLESGNSNSILSGLPLYQLFIVFLGSINTVL